MDGSDDNVEDIVRNLLWTELDVDDEGKVSVNELGRCLRQHGVDVSNFAILRILSDGTAPKTSMDHEQFVDTKDKLIVELNSTEPLTPDDKKKKQRATYLDLWREHSRSKDESGEIPLSNLPDVIFSECNPTKELLNVLMTIKSDGSESLNFKEFCEMLDNLPTSGMISEDMLMKAFQTEDADGSGYLSRTQLYSLLIESGSEPLKKEEVDEMMEDCGSGDKFKYTGNFNANYLAAVRKVKELHFLCQIFDVSSWSVFRQTVRTNNDVEGWHHRLNSNVHVQAGILKACTTTETGLIVGGACP